MRPTNGCQIQECLPKASLSFVSYLFAKSKTTAHIMETIYLYIYYIFSYPFKEMQTTSFKAVCYGSTC